MKYVHDKLQLRLNRNSRIEKYSNCNEKFTKLESRAIIDFNWQKN